MHSIDATTPSTILLFTADYLESNCAAPGIAYSIANSTVRDNGVKTVGTDPDF
jgi:hypothetical protein